METDFKTIDQYIAMQPERNIVPLEKIRQTIRKAAPDAEETISYQMPAFTYHGILVYFAGFKNHIGLYALPTGNTAFQKELEIYKTGKGSIQFPLDKPIPYELIRKIVKFRIKENEKEMLRKLTLANERKQKKQS